MHKPGQAIVSLGVTRIRSRDFGVVGCELQGAGCDLLPCPRPKGGRKRFVTRERAQRSPEERDDSNASLLPISAINLDLIP
jgi:hypothetical protein